MTEGPVCPHLRGEGTVTPLSTPGARSPLFLEGSSGVVKVVPLSGSDDLFGWVYLRSILGLPSLCKVVYDYSQRGYVETVVLPS